MLSEPANQTVATDVALTPGQDIVPDAPPRRQRATYARALTVTLSLLVLGAAVWQALRLDLAEVTALVPSSPLFAVTYLATPLVNVLIFHVFWCARQGNDGHSDRWEISVTLHT